MPNIAWKPAAQRLAESTTRYARQSYACNVIPCAMVLSPFSVASSRRLSAYRALEETAAARTAMLKAEAEAHGALTRLADTGAECNEHLKVITAELAVMQSSVKDCLRANNQQELVQTVQN